MTTPPSEEGGFSRHACITYRYVKPRRLRPSPKSVSSSQAIRSRVNGVIAGRGAALNPPRLRTFYRAEDYPPEPPISGCQEPNDPQSTLPILSRKGGTRGFLRRPKTTVPAT